nr:unknown [Ipomoea trifida]
MANTFSDISEPMLLLPPSPVSIILTFPHIHVLVTTIWLVVSVPVLSVQMQVAEPIVSHAERVLTSALLSINCFIANARLSVTARGNPSGTATTIIVTAVAKNVNTANPSPIFPIIVATPFSLTCSGVSSSPLSLRVSISLPHSVLIPTVVTSIVAEPSCTLVPDKRKGLFSDILTGTLSPDKLD